MPAIARNSSCRALTSPCTPPEATRTAFARSSALARARPCPSTIARSSLSPSPPAPRRCSFSRGRSCSATVFIVHHTLLYFRAMRRLAALLLILLAAGCSKPPNKEINRAQGAIDAARSAGADQYAADSFTAATSALQQAHEAVDQRDYRLALSRAIDAYERAQDAAKLAADGKAKARSDAEMIVSTANAAALALDAKLRAAEAAHVPARDLAESRRIS